MIHLVQIYYRRYFHNGVDLLSNGFKIRQMLVALIKMEAHIFILHLQNLLSKTQEQGNIDMAFKLDGKPLAVDVAFKTSDGTQYPANWLRLSTADEKTALGITEVADDPVYDSRFYNGDGSAKALDDVNAKDEKVI